MPRLALGLLLLLVVPACGEASSEEAPAVFPASWVGRYHGDLKVVASDGTVQEIPTDLSIERTDDPDRFGWRLRYGTQPWRNYELVVEDGGKGRYAIDEKNGIVLPAVFLGGELVSVFSVMKSRITIRYRRSGDAVRLDVLSTSSEAAGKTGGADGVPEVHHYRVQNLQHGLLEPVEDE